VQWTGTVHSQNGTPRHWNSILKIGTVYWQTCTMYQKCVQYNLLTKLYSTVYWPTCTVYWQTGTVHQKRVTVYLQTSTVQWQNSREAKLR
jgi:hypothetical protein